jgi:molybdopterin adenylyltransferase
VRVAIITSSDRCSRGEAVDESGPAIADFCQEQDWPVVARRLLPDELDQLTLALIESVDRDGAELVLTTGGTGMGPRDCMPEATVQAVDRMAPGIAEGLRAESLKLTPFAMLSRGAAGLRGQSLIINLPGSPRAVRECLQILAPILPHAIATAGGAGH